MRDMTHSRMWHDSGTTASGATHAAAHSCGTRIAPPRRAGRPLRPKRASPLARAPSMKILAWWCVCVCLWVCMCVCVHERVCVSWLIEREKDGEIERGRERKRERDRESSPHHRASSMNTLMVCVCMCKCVCRYSLFVWRCATPKHLYAFGVRRKTVRGACVYVLVCAWHDSVHYVCVTWLCVCDMTVHMCGGRATPSYVHVCIRVIRLIHMRDMTHVYAWHDSFICVTWLTCVCNMTHAFEWHDACHMTHAHMTHAYEWHDLSMCVTTRAHVWRDSMMCVTRRIHTCNHTRVNVTHMNESCHTHQCHTYEWVLPQTSM